jgi:hypothetical protein
MADFLDAAEILKVLALVRSRIARYRGDTTFNEEKTKASLIEPVLKALGWDTNDPDEVDREYKPKSKDNPVDYALLLRRTPCLLLEAKTLRDDLRDRKLVKQVINYASMAGVRWGVLSNGDEYRIYNVGVDLPADDKLFRVVSVTGGEQSMVIGTLSLLSKPNLQDKRIDRLWASHFVDRQVKVALEKLLNPEDPAKSLVRAVRKITEPRLGLAEISASLRRARLHLDFPEEPEASVAVQAQVTKRGQRGRRTAEHEVSLRTLISEGVLRTPVQLSCRYRGQELTATVQDDGMVSVGGDLYPSPSAAAGAARKPYYKGDLRGHTYPETNGWKFWYVKDPATQKAILLDALRVRCLLKKKAEAQRFASKDA